MMGAGVKRVDAQERNVQLVGERRGDQHVGAGVARLASRWRKMFGRTAMRNCGPMSRSTVR